MRRAAAALLLCAALCGGAAPARAGGAFAVAVPGSGLVEVQVYLAHLAYRGAVVVQGEGGPDAPCAPFPGMVRCVVEAGPLTTIALLYDPLPPTCTARASARARVAGDWRPPLVDGGAGPRCLWLPLAGAGR